MKIKITARIPVSEEFRPEIGSIHEVKRWNEIKRRSQRLYYIEYNGTEVGVYGYECEDVEED